MASEGVVRRGASWRARYRHPETGRQYEKTFARMVDGQRWRRKQLDAIDAGRWVSPGAGTITFERYFEQWAERQVWTSGTQKAMSLAVRSASFRSMQLRLIRPTHVESWVKSMSVVTLERKKPLAAGTIKTRFINVRTVFKAAVRDQELAVDPTRDVKLPRQRKREATMAIPRPEEVGQIMAAADDRFRAFVAVCAFAGLRLGEAAALRFEDVDFLRRQLHVRRQVQRADQGQVEIRLPKYNSERSVPLPDGLLEILARHVELGHASEWLFAGAEDQPPHQNTVGHRWRVTQKRAGLSGIRLHDLRHFYASGLIASSCDVVTVQKALGHAKATTTLSTYSHLWPSAEDKTRAAAAALVEEVLTPSEGRVRGEQAD